MTILLTLGVVFIGGITYLDIIREAPQFSLSPTLLIVTVVLAIWSALGLVSTLRQLRGYRLGTTIVPTQTESTTPR